MIFATILVISETNRLTMNGKFRLTKTLSKQRLAKAMTSILLSSKTIGLLLLLLSLCPLLSTAQNPYIVTATRLNVRKLPSAESAIIGSLSKGDVVNVRELKKSWAKIDFKNSIGYVSLKYIQPIEVEEETNQEDESEESAIELVDTQNIEVAESSNRKSGEWFTRTFKQFHFRLTSTLSLGISNFHSFDAYSHPRFGFGVDAGTQITADFLPRWWLSEITIGYMSLGNSNYSFPSFSLNILPGGYRSDPFQLGKLRNMRYYAAGGMTFQFSGGGIFFYRNSQNYSFYPKPTVNVYIKGGIELSDMVAVGFLYMHGLNDVCRDLPIGIKHSVFQIYGSFLFDKWKKK